MTRALKLYHFTSARHLRGISKYGLTIGDVPTDIRRWKSRVGVWFTSVPDAVGHGLEGGATDKTRYRLTVEVPANTSLVKWLEWASANVSPETIRALHLTATNYASWYVYFGVLPPTAIIQCVDMAIGQTVDNWAELSPPELDVRGVPAYRRMEWQKKMLKGVLRAVQGACQ